MQRRSAIVVGVLFILAAVTSIAGLLLYGPLLGDADYVTSGSPDSSSIASGAFLEVLLAFSVIGTSIAMFPIVRKFSQAVALGVVAFRLLEAAIILVGAISLLSVVTLGQQFTQAASPDVSAYQVAGKALVAVHDWTFLFGPNFALAPSTVMMGLFFYRSKLVPRVIAVLGMVGGSLIFVSGTLVLFGVYPQISVWGSLLALPVFGYEMSLAVWLIVKGFSGARGVERSGAPQRGNA